MKILALITLVLASCNFGCAVFEPAQLPGPPAVTAAQQTQAAINEANLLITASAYVLDDHKLGGLVTDKQYEDFGDRLLEYAKQVDAVQRALRDGVPTAPQQAAILKHMLLLIHREITDLARKS